MKQRHVKNGLICALLLGSSLLNFSAAVPDEGMYPLSQLNRAGLKKAGLKISEKDIYNPGQTGLVDALVQVSGCSGSFVSPNGLIITNHHCAFSAVQLASSPEFNYLKNGFVAHSYEQEIEAKGLSIRITDSYEDVSEEILGAVAQISDPAERMAVINKKRAQLVAQAEAEDPSIKAEVSEMFIGKSYVLFRYKTIEDVRLVYVPRQDIGDFGGESDNWVWPRHSGDFSFLRAYVAPDGSSAKYAKENVPYQPKKHLKVNPKGVDEDDFVFILGYPGRTFRHRPADYIQYQQNYLLPYTADLYDFQNQQMEAAGEKDPKKAIALATRIKRNANVLKNYRGKLKGLHNLDLVAKKQTEDQALADFISRTPALKAKYASLMQDIAAHYQMVNKTAYKELWFNNMYRNLSLFQVANTLLDFQQAIAKQPSQKEQEEIFQLNIEQVKAFLADIYASYDLQVDQQVGRRMFEDAYSLSEANQIEYFAQQQFKSQSAAGDYITQSLAVSKLSDPEKLYDSVLKDRSSLMAYTDNLLRSLQVLDSELTAFRKEQQAREGELNRLMGDYIAVKEQYQAKDFVPDANSTLRLTFGRIRGYNPVDASYMAPFSSIRGIIEKGASGSEEYAYPESIKTAWLAKNFGAYVKEELQDVPVNILYNTDTTGGNSGSPIMNAYGELIGVNFDRAYEATINDYAWDEHYSRSIGVDIRYVLWVADKIDHAQFILKEMGV